MSARVRVSGCALFAATALAACLVMAEEKEPASQEMPPGYEKMIQLGTPGEHHKHLAPFAGNFTAQAKFWMSPEQPAEESSATATTKWVLDGRYLQMEYRSEWQGQAFTGLSFMGYDNQKQQYFSTWMDSMSTALHTSYGECDAAHKTFTFRGEMFDPITEKQKKTRSVYRILSEAKIQFEWYETGDDGKETKTMEIVYTRA
jgi:hypothetical protein